jgi:hypothetical protein
MIAPKEAFRGFRWREDDFLHGIQDVEFSRHCVQSGFLLAQLEDIRIEHLGAREALARKFPAYLARQKLEKTRRYGRDGRDVPGKYVIDYDDFTVGTALSNLLRIKKHYPGFKVTAFTIPMHLSVLKKELPFERLKAWAEVVREYDWIEIAVHGYAHLREECLVDRAKAERLLSESEKTLTELGLPWVKVFKAPHWLASREMYECLRDRGYLVAVDRNQLKPDVPGLKTYTFNWSLDETVLPSEEWIKGHGHFYGTPNDILLTMSNLFSNLPTQASFQAFASEP